MRSGGSLLLGSYGCDGGVHLLLRLQWMPLGDGTAGVGQHVGPVFEPGPRGLASHQDLPDGVILADLVVIQHRDHGLDFLRGRRVRTLQSQKFTFQSRSFLKAPYFSHFHSFIFHPRLQ